MIFDIMFSIPSCDDEVEAVLIGVYLGNVDMEEAGRIRLEAGLLGLGAVHLGQPSDAVVL
jgi:hypothetical protein